MQISNMTTHIRLRKPYEAIDLGFTLARHYFMQLLPSWFSFLIIFGLLVWTLTPFEYIGFASLAIWWLKPLYDRILLHHFSHYLFGQKLSAADTFMALPKLITNTGLLGALTWRRLSWSRSYNLPIWQLEGLRGKERSQRQSLIYKQNESNAIFLTMICMNIEMVLVIALYGLLVFLDPTDQAWGYLQEVFVGNFSHGVLEYWSTLLGFIFYLLVILIIEPFFIAAGFMLYLNRRTQLEAWDLDIQLRQIGERITKLTQGVSSVLLVVITASLFSAPQPSFANDEYLSPERLTAEHSSEQIEQVMQSDELNQRSKTERWVYTGDMDDVDVERDDSSEIGQLLASIVEHGLWIGIVIAILLAIIFRKQIMSLLIPLASKKQEEYQAPEILFGLDVRPASLPSNPEEQARILWEAKQYREALSLLYRVALVRLTQEHELAIEHFHTEEDVLHLSTNKLTPAAQQHFTHLTRFWQRIAYGHSTPAHDAIDGLIQDWEQLSATEIKESVS